MVDCIVVDGLGMGLWNVVGIVVDCLGMRLQYGAGWVKGLE